MNQNIQLSVSPEQLEMLVSAYISAAKIECLTVGALAGVLFLVGLLLFLYGRSKDGDWNNGEGWIVCGAFSAGFAVMLLIVCACINAPAFTPYAHDWALAKLVTSKR